MLPVVMFVAFLLVPIAEIIVIIEVGSVIGGWQTAALLLAESLLGAWIVRREGRRAWRALQGTFTSGRLPDRELADAALVLVGGVLLLTPGFLSDVVGFLFVLPFTRPLVRRLLAAYAGRRVKVGQRRMAEFPGAFPGAGFPPGSVPRPARSGAGQDRAAEGPVIQGEVLHEDDRDSPGGADRSTP